MPRKEPLAEKIWKNLYKSNEDLPVHFSENELEIKFMYENVFCKWLDKPELEDKDIILLLKNEHGRSHAQSYRDIAIIKEVLGNVRNAAKEWQRYTVIKMLKECYDIAKRGNKTKEMIMAADKLGKYTKLDKDDLDNIPWEQIVPPSWEPSADASLLGIKDLPEDIESKKNELRKKYLRNSSIPIAEIIDNDES